MAYLVTNIAGSKLLLGRLELEVGATEEVECVTSFISAALFNNLIKLDSIASPAIPDGVVSIASSDHTITWIQTALPGGGFGYTSSVNTTALAPAMADALKDLSGSIQIKDAFSAPIGTILSA